ncbi:hypothetical protein BBK82_37455 [Lentzea guizhouensis]|uniref:Uncharacterized protein n=1 Tax=Lentzea guizhouensis TaxID=1586287 RepID=A0A1B2HSX2_9PSEU|nr:hypothetical protein [Lentzea guizhouensis]ANZ40829.1 hypothetical protein BBK82_37455 [Lentzea guizhouensis]
MLWLFSQMFVLCLVSFTVGCLLTWFVLRRRTHTGSPKTLLALPAPRAAQEKQILRQPVVEVAEEPVVTVPAEQESLPVKGNSRTMVYHTPESPYYRRMKGDVTFETETEALKAGYRMWTTKARVRA